MRIKAIVYIFNGLYYNDFYRSQNWSLIDWINEKELKMPTPKILKI